MIAIIESDFKGSINGVLFYSQQDYQSVLWLVSLLEEKFDYSIDDSEFVDDIKDFLDRASRKIDLYSPAEMEYATSQSIEAARSLEEVRFLANEYDEEDSSWNGDINDKLARRLYSMFNV